MIEPRQRESVTPTLRINGASVPVRPRETVLQAALRAGIDFPNSCRVGGCGTCRCRVAQGEVTELTESGYLLGADEIDRGVVLACQSVPKGDVSIEVDLGDVAVRGLPGRVIAQERVTHDITRLCVQLDGSLSYRAGQFANLTIEGLEGVVRSYSFATPPESAGRLSFLVRKVPGGLVSSLVHDGDLIGRTVHVDGPRGDFYLRSADAPLLFVAGGSGLAPILAILEEAVAARVARPATLLFGAREARDLYALEQIESIRKRWRGELRFVPVLSEAAGDDGWTGERGLVTEKISGLLEPGAHAYLCGPPAMIDGAIALLADQGVAAEHIHFDRFTTRADAPDAGVGRVTGERSSPARRSPAGSAGAPAPMCARRRDAVERSAGLFHYLKYFAFHFLGLLSAVAIFRGPDVAADGLLTVVVLYMLGDALLGDDKTTPRFRFPQILTFQLWLALPLLALIVFAAVWSVSPGDPLGAGAFIEQTFQYPAIARREAATFGDHLGVFVLAGLMIGMIGTISGHELTHRTWDPVSLCIGRWLLAFSFDTSFAIEHVYGHHRYVSTTHDPATAPRGRNVYTHIVASTVKGNMSAWEIEVERLRKKHLPVWSRHNAILLGQAMSLVLLGTAFAMGGWLAAGFFALCGLWGKALLEIVNYMEHYGMVRNPATPVEPRHSWNTNRRISSWTMFNLTRHSHHHAQGEVPYQDLEPYPNAPMMVSGYLTTIAIAMIPPLWHYLMTPKVLAWDRDYATAEERELAAVANQTSGLRALARHGAAREVRAH